MYYATVWVRAMSRYRATMTQAPDFAYRLAAERFASSSLVVARSSGSGKRNYVVGLYKLRLYNLNVQ
jgi:hypothetical protein